MSATFFALAPEAAAPGSVVSPVVAPRANVARKIIVAAGGTGGHFFPAEALAIELSSRGHDVALMCDARSGGLASDAFAGKARIVIEGAGIAGRGVARAAKAVVALAKGTVQAHKMLRVIKPAAVVAFGGYPSVAPILGASLMRDRPRLVLHEQNAVLGRANRLLCRRADVLALAIGGTTKIPAHVPSVVTGNPVRPQVAALRGNVYAAPAETISLLVLGGSLGARVLSDVVPAALAALPVEMKSKLRVTQQCRAEDIERVRAAYDAAKIQADLATFFSNVETLLRSAHLVICRAGASTVAELAIAGRPSILVPLPGAIDDHQTANAAALVKAGAAWLVPQPQFQPSALETLMRDLFSNPRKLAEAAANAAALGHADAASRLADLVESSIAKGEQNA